MIIRRALLLVALLCAGLVGPAGALDNPVPADKQLRRAKLNLSQKQREALAELQRNSRSKSDRLKGQIGKLRRDLEREYRAYRLRTDRIQDLHRQINTAQASLLDVHLETQQGLRRILTTKQFARLQESLDDDDDDDDDD